MIERYDAPLRRTARRHSLCAADADDAYQRALEILLSKAPDVGPERLVRWMHTVTRHEAYAVRKQRERLLNSNRAQTEDGTEVDTLDLLPSDSPEPDVGVERSERVRRGFEALKSLKPQEIRTLTLKAEGYSYEEIGEITGFSRTKINRCMVEGRRHFLDKFAAIEEGARCDELSPSLSAYADGELETGVDQLMAHVEGCAHCRAKLREYRGVPKRVLGLAPLGVMAGPSTLSRAADRLHGAGERLKEVGSSLIHRGTSAMDASQTVAAGGGTRGSGLALLGVVCGLGASGGAAYCVDQGALPVHLGGRHERPAAAEPDEQQPTAAPPDATSVGTPVPPPVKPVDEWSPAPAEEPRREFDPSATADSTGGTREFGEGAPAPSGASGGGSSGGGGGSSGGKESFGL